MSLFFCHLEYDDQFYIKNTRTIIRRIRLLVKVNLYFWGMKMMDGVYLLLGTNLGDRMANLNKALLEISSRIGRVRKQSSVYETDAWGKTDQAAFLNMVVSVDTLLSPLQILEQISLIEQAIGRVRVEKWRERVIDIDLLYHGSLVVDLPNLQVPHPEIARRRFTLVPLNEIASEFMHPIFLKTQHQLLAVCEDTLSVRNVGKLMDSPIQ